MHRDCTVGRVRFDGGLAQVASSPVWPARPCGQLAREVRYLRKKSMLSKRPYTKSRVLALSLAALGGDHHCDVILGRKLQIVCDEASNSLKATVSC